MMSARSASHRSRGSRPLLFLSLAVIALLVCCVMIVGLGRNFERNTAYAESVPVKRSTAMPEPAAADIVASDVINRDEYKVQAVLSAKRRAVLASGMDARIIKFNFKNGDVFKEGDVLIEYDCAVDQARLREAQSRQRLTQVQLEAYEKLHDLKSISDVEYVVAKENNEQNIAMVDQIRGRIRYCKVIAPFNGRVTNKMASQYEFVQTGRVLMDISSREALQAEFLVPSKWLRWLNIGTPLHIYIGESDHSYAAKIVAVHGEVDPVSQSVQVVAEMEQYHEELLPGMSGQATFDLSVTKVHPNQGFIGFVLNGNEMDNHGPSQIK